MTSCSIILVSLAIVQLVMDVTDKATLVLTMCLLGKYSAAASRASMRTLTGESFPTAVRNTGFGFVGFAGAGIGLVAPQIAFLGAS
jgi:hypothetical protein